MNILLYYQNSYHTVFLESLVESFINKGHKVFFLTTCERGLLHDKIESIGAQVSIHTYDSETRKIAQYIGQTRFLIKFCKKNKIDVVYAHLQLANLFAVFAQYFIKAKVFPCRHHANDVLLRGNKNALLIDKLVTRFSKKIIVVSNAVKKHMVEQENAKAKKIEVIPLGYNFSFYDQPNETKVQNIKERINCRFLLIVIGRMNVNKRHIVALEVLRKLIHEKLDVKMLLLDDGPEKQNLIAYINEHHLSDKVVFTGFLNNTMNYVKASDLLLHPSISEASNQVVKEAGILNVPSVVCEHVGDFDEYIIHKQNGFVVNTVDTAEEMYALVKEYYYKKDELNEIGHNAKPVIEAVFDIKNVSELYLKLAH